MISRRRVLILLPAYLLVLGICLLIGIGGSSAITAISQTELFHNRYCVIIDAGHGGEDGGATSCTGILESDYNLKIALRLDCLMQLLGVQTKMIRTSDVSIYTHGNSIAEKKISDLKERVRIVNQTPNALLVSIHQNYFPQSKYKGAQVFYGRSEGSMLFAKNMQSLLVKNLNTDSTRTAKKADSIYLLQKTACPAILIECGFLSNREEEELLRSEDYQKKLCCVVAVGILEQLGSMKTLS